MPSRRMTLSIALLLGACASPSSPSAVVPPEGPPQVRASVVRTHAVQFEEDVPVRMPGSQEELAAATYLLGHLQSAGYSARLDGVPVEDLVRSTNVLTLPPGDRPTRVLVAVVYDTGREGSDGTALGLWLELARAAAVRADGEPDARFAALGAEHASVSGGHLGSRRLAQILLEAGEEPELAILLVPGDSISVAGSFARRFEATTGVEAGRLPEGSFAVRTASILGKVAGDHLVVAGPPETVGPLVLDLIGRRGDAG